MCNVSTINIYISNVYSILLFLLFNLYSKGIRGHFKQLIFQLQLQRSYVKIIFTPTFN